MSRKYQCQRTEPHPSHEWVLHKPIKDWENCDCPILDCEGVNFVEFKVGDKVRPKTVEITKIKGKEFGYEVTVKGYSFPGNGGPHGYAFNIFDIELVERPEPPLPDWLENPNIGQAIIFPYSNYVYFYSPSRKCWQGPFATISHGEMVQFYREGKTKRLVPES